MHFDWLQVHHNKIDKQSSTNQAHSIKRCKKNIKSQRDSRLFRFFVFTVVSRNQIKLSIALHSSFSIGTGKMILHLINHSKAAKRKKTKRNFLLSKKSYVVLAFRKRNFYSNYGYPKSGKNRLVEWYIHIKKTKHHLWQRAKKSENIVLYFIVIDEKNTCSSTFSNFYYLFIVELKLKRSKTILASDRKK